MTRSSGAPLVLAAVILAAGMLGGAAILKSGLDAGSAELHDLGVAVAGLGNAGKGAGPVAARPTPERRPGPDPRERHQVSIEGAPVRGNPAAKVTIVEFADFQCPFCGRVEPTLEKLLHNYGDQVRVVYKNMPLSMHPRAKPAALAAAAAGRQGKFWEMHDLIFAHQRELGDEKLVEYARQLGLDVKQFEKDMASPELAKRVESDVAEGEKLGVRGTPSFFINGRFFAGAQPYAAFKARIDAELATGQGHAKTARVDAGAARPPGS